MEQDLNRFKNIVKGKIKEGLRKYISSGELIGKQGKNIVRIPVPHIDIPRFIFGSNQGGVGQGDGEVGDVISKGQPSPGEGQGKAGKDPAEHILEVDLSLEELADIIGEELELPNIQEKGKKNIATKRYRYTGLHTVGSESLRHFKKSYLQALKRMISLGDYDPDDPVVIVEKRDRRYRTYNEIIEPEANAAIIYIMDVSGSMGEEQKEIVRLESFWIDMWLRKQYKGVERRYIIHDAAAKEVDEHTFYHTRESGGTLISSAYKVCQNLISKFYSPSEWNIYVFQFSDGDNWSGNDTAECMDILKYNVFPAVNMFAYGQVESRYGSGQFMKDLEKAFGKEHQALVLSHIKGKDDIMDSIKEFLGKGK